MCYGVLCFHDATGCRSFLVWLAQWIIYIELSNRRKANLFGLRSFCPMKRVKFSFPLPPVDGGIIYLWRQYNLISRGCAINCHKGKRRPRLVTAACIRTWIAGLVGERSPVWVSQHWRETPWHLNRTHFNVYLLTWNSREFKFDFFFPFMTEWDLPPLFLVAAHN